MCNSWRKTQWAEMSDHQKYLTYQIKVVSCWISHFSELEFIKFLSGVQLHSELRALASRKMFCSKNINFEQCAHWPKFRLRAEVKKTAYAHYSTSWSIQEETREITLRKNSRHDAKAERFNLHTSGGAKRSLNNSLIPISKDKIVSYIKCQKNQNRKNDAFQEMLLSSSSSCLS